MTNPKPYKPGDHLVICDRCGRQVYRSQTKYQWDGLLCCTVYNCWDFKDPIFINPPVINDPAPLLDVRPDLPINQTNYVSDVGQVGLLTTFNSFHFTFDDALHKKFGKIDSPPDYWNTGD